MLKTNEPYIKGYMKIDICVCIMDMFYIIYTWK